MGRDARERGRIVALCLLAALGGLAAALAAEQPPFRDSVVVERVVLDVRAVDRSGDPIMGLGPDDFTVLVDKREVRLESAEWIAGTRVAARSETPVAAAGVAPEQEATKRRIVVLFFQNDFHASRLSGLMRMWPKASALLDTLEPQDLVAVLSFDSHLKLHCDLTTDRAATRSSILPTVIFRQPAPVVPAGELSLAAHIDPGDALDAATPEQGLAVTARALEAIPGVKTLVYLGWGLGRFSRSGVRLPDEYFDAVASLTRAHTTVITLDVTDADYHSLEVGLEQVAYDTGGFYAKTHLFPDLAMKRLSSALAGYYEIVFEKPDLPSGRHAVDVRLARLDGTVLARPAYTD